jgi:hypothetical protein
MAGRGVGELNRALGDQLGELRRGAERTVGIDRDRDLAARLLLDQALELLRIGVLDAAFDLLDRELPLLGHRGLAHHGRHDGARHKARDPQRQ